MYKIAISGKAGSGKNTLSRAIMKELRKISPNKNILPMYMAFADPIKCMIQHMYPKINTKHLFGDSKYRNQSIDDSFYENKPLTIRKLLQELGENCKKYNPKIWINALDYKMNEANDDTCMFISDLRFVDEFNYLKEKDFYIIRIIRDDSLNMNHISETQQNQIKNEQFDKIVINNGSLYDLKNQAKEIAKLIL